MTGILETLLIHAPALIVAIPLLGAFLTMFVGKLGEKVRNIFVLCILGLTNLFIWILSYDVFTTGEIRTYVFGGQNPSIPAIQPVIRILFEIDAMSMFMVLISGLLVLVAVIYSWAFMKGNTGLDKYYTMLLLITTGMLGMELTGDLFNFFVFLEITSIGSASLVAFWVNKAECLEAAFKYIMVSAIGALFVLFAIALLYGQYNALNMAVLANNIQYTFLDKIALGALLIALSMKAGLVPMHMWLPDAYSKAPATVTLALIGATLASFYGALRVVFTVYGNVLSNLLRFDIPVSSLIGGFLIALALATIIIGVLMALRQSDFKRMIGFAAVAEIGYMMLAIGTGIVAFGTSYGTIALQAGIFHIFNDALDVGLLFLVAGAIYYATQQTSLDRMGGLARNMKYTTIFFVIGLLAISGMPPFNGFASKLLIYESTFLLNPILAIVAILCSILLLAAFVKVFYAAFMGPQLPQYSTVKEVPKSMLIAMGIIAVFIVFIGLFPGLILTNLVQPATEALLTSQNYISALVGGL